MVGVLDGKRKRKKRKKKKKEKKGKGILETASLSIPIPFSGLLSDTIVLYSQQEKLHKPQDCTFPKFTSAVRCIRFDPDLFPVAHPPN